MTTRSRTLLFLQYRNSYARSQGSTHLSGGSTEREGLIESSDSIIEMSVLPPQWVDIVDQVDDALDHIKEKITRLEGMHRKHLLPGFDDRSSDEEAIERLTSDITDEFYRIKRDIQRIHSEGYDVSDGQQDYLLAKNIQTSLATKVQEVSSSFRKQQSTYLQKIQGQENRKADILGLESSLSNEAAELLLDEDAQVGFTESQLAVLESNEAVIDQREREVNQIAKSIHQLAEIFRDLQTLVIDQGSMLDRIDYNIEQTTVQVKEAVVQLDQVSSTAKLGKFESIDDLLVYFVLKGIALSKQNTETKADPFVDPNYYVIDYDSNSKA
ncbi:t-SNARE [Phycomyces blakesleeanus]|uniref:t-SNARE n=1 Tax=Phycomyces blakesleeanus TaxID=4837 RepID=A0ABR3APR0_PHYBL